MGEKKKLSFSTGREREEKKERERERNEERVFSLHENGMSENGCCYACGYSIKSIKSKVTMSEGRKKLFGRE